MHSSGRWGRNQGLLLVAYKREIGHGLRLVPDWPGPVGDRDSGPRSGSWSCAIRAIQAKPCCLPVRSAKTLL